MATASQNIAASANINGSGPDGSSNAAALSTAGEVGSGRPPRSKSGTELSGSGALPLSSGITGMSAVDSPVSGSPPAGAAARRTDGLNGTGPAKSLPATRRHSGDANGATQSPATSTAGLPAGAAATSLGTMPPISGPKEDSLSSHLERLRINAQAAKNGAQNGGMGAIGSRDGRRGPAAGSRLAKAAMQGGNPALAGASAAAALARGGSNAGSAGNDANMSTFMFDDELDNELHSSTYGGRYLQMNADDDKFPVLIRRDSYPGILSASSAALDLAPLSQTPPRNAFLRGEASGRTSEWPQFSENGATTNTASTTSAGAAQGKPSTGANTPAAGPPAGSRLSADLTTAVNGARPRNLAESPRGGRLPPPRSATTGIATPSNVSVVSATTGNTTATSTTASNFTDRTSPGLDAATSPKKSSTLPINGNAAAPASPEELKRKAQLQRERERLERANLDGVRFSDGTPSPAGMYASELAALNGTFSPYPLDKDFPAPYGGNYGSFGQRRGPPNGAAPAGVQSQQGQQKRDEPNRFAGLRLEDLQGDMAQLCKDQHGCRFLQKKLEEGNPEHRDMIFAEIYPHFGELMTDSFGNYLSQKLLEHSTDEQRDALLESISGELVSISLNMHGTRAVQKMIDYLSTQRQVQSLIMALNLNVVTLIKDLNGNHVIQKCLNTLPPEDNQFIYNAVAANCIEVATHRHGCCVLQRCIDHASESQRIQLVTEITYNSLTLVLDPFGNYVVQYVLDLNDSRFITAIVNQFRNNVCALSAQKFSSNVVEKCIRVADLEGRKALISELIDRSRLERMLRDSFANYVVQTALDYAEPGQRAELVAIIRPVLPMIRNTPYGKRIQSKIQREGFHDGYRGGYHHGGNMYGGMGMGMAPYYGMPPYGAPHGPGMYGHHAPPPGAPHHYGGPEHMGRGAGPYPQYPQHMPPHPGMPPQGFNPSYAPSPVPMEYPQQGGNYGYM